MLLDSKFNLNMCAFAVASALTLTACGNDSDNNGFDHSSPDSPTVVTKQTVISGTITDSSGNPLANATVTNGKMTAKTDASGNYTLALDNNAPTETVVMVKKSGYLTTARELIVSPKQAYDLDVSLSPDQVSTAFAGSAGVTDLNVGGAKVTIPANAVVNADGSDFAGTVNISASYYNPDSIEGMQSFAQPFAGQDEDGSNRTDLVTVGVIDVKLTDPATGATLNLKDGSKATLSFPEATTDQDLSSIPLWYYDEEKLIWVKDGVATRQADGSYQGTVSHFTLWNLDIPVGEYSALLEGCVMGDDADTLATEFYASIVGRGFVNYGGVDAQGKFSVEVPINTPLTLSPRYTPYEFDAISIPALEQDTTYQVNDGTCIDVSKKEQNEVVDVEEVTELPPIPIQLPVNKPTQGLIGYGFGFDTDYSSVTGDTLDGVEITTATSKANSVNFIVTPLYDEGGDMPSEYSNGNTYILTPQGIEKDYSFRWLDDERSMESTSYNTTYSDNKFEQRLDNGFVEIAAFNDVPLTGQLIGDVLARDEFEDLPTSVIDRLNSLGTLSNFSANATCKVPVNYTFNTDHFELYRNDFAPSFGDFNDAISRLDNPTTGEWAGIPWAYSTIAEEYGRKRAVAKYNNDIYGGEFIEVSSNSIDEEEKDDCVYYNETAKDDILKALAQAYPEL